MDAPRGIGGGGRPLLSPSQSPLPRSMGSMRSLQLWLFLSIRPRNMRHCKINVAKVFRYSQFMGHKPTPGTADQSEIWPRGVDWRFAELTAYHRLAKVDTISGYSSCR